MQSVVRQPGIEFRVQERLRCTSFDGHLNSQPFFLQELNNQMIKMWYVNHLNWETDAFQESSCAVQCEEEDRIFCDCSFAEQRKKCYLLENLTTQFSSKKQSSKKITYYEQFWYKFILETAKVRKNSKFNFKQISKQLPL